MHDFGKYVFMHTCVEVSKRGEDVWVRYICCLHVQGVCFSGPICPSRLHGFLRKQIVTLGECNLVFTLHKTSCACDGPNEWL